MDACQSERISFRQRILPTNRQSEWDIRYDVSYSQVYDWVRKYVADGETGLIDRRGHHKTDEEVDEMERLRRENRRLKRQLEEQERLVYFLKKLKALEGR